MRTGTSVLAMVAALAWAGGAGAQVADNARRAEVETRAAARAWIGITFDETGSSGAVVVTNVWPDSPAARANVQEGDTIVLWNGQRDVSKAVADTRLQSGDSVRLRIRRGRDRDRDVAVVAAPRPARVVLAPGARVRTLTPSRGGREIIITVPDERELRILADSFVVRADSLHRRLREIIVDSLGPEIRRLERVQIPRIRVEVDGQGRTLLPGAVAFNTLGSRSIAGAELAEMNAGLSPYFGTDHGVIVMKVAPETPASRSGLQAGDVVVEANDARVNNIAELRRAVVRAQSNDGRDLELKVVRKGKSREVKLHW